MCKNFLIKYLKIHEKKQEAHCRNMERTHMTLVSHESKLANRRSINTTTKVTLIELRSTNENMVKKTHRNT
jgi:hypothetical protein